LFSIKDIEAVSGIKSHTLRIWEQRYGIITPKRTQTNIRYYDEADLKLVLNISILNRHGYKISEIAKLSSSQIHEIILKLSGSKDVGYDTQIKGLISAMLLYDEHEFHKLLTTSVIQIGFEKTMINLLLPFLSEIGVLWQVGSINPAHEHFASNIIKQKLYVAIDGNVGRYCQNRKRFLLFLHENEKHTIGLLFANYVLRSRGHDVLYLGQELPTEDLKKSGEFSNPDYVLTILTSALSNTDKQKIVDLTAASWPNANILLTGSQLMNNDFVVPTNASVIYRIEDFIALVDSISIDQSTLHN